MAHCFNGDIPNIGGSSAIIGVILNFFVLKKIEKMKILKNPKNRNFGNFEIFKNPKISKSRKFWSAEFQIFENFSISKKHLRKTSKCPQTCSNQRKFANFFLKSIAMDMGNVLYLLELFFGTQIFFSHSEFLFLG